MALYKSNIIIMIMIIIIIIIIIIIDNESNESINFKQVTVKSDAAAESTGWAKKVSLFIVANFNNFWHIYSIGN